MHKLETLLDGLCFPEGPRWHDGRLFFSDMHAHQVMAVDLGGRAQTIVEVPAQPSGLGWLPDGRMLVVSMTDRKIMRLEGGNLVLHADLSRLASCHCNDMVVDRAGRAYVGNFGFDLHASQPQKDAELIMVRPDGHASVALRDLKFPNGAVITPDGKTLIVGETFARRLTAFDIQGDATLANRRVWADLKSLFPDGICLDSENGVWVACPTTSQVVRVVEGGQVTDTIKVATDAFACMLGGAERRTLFLATANNSDPEKCRLERSGKIEFTQVEIPGAGLP